MKKFSRATIQSVLDRAIREFMDDESAPYTVNFIFKGHFVEAKFCWSPTRLCYYVSQFSVVYSRCVMLYFVRNDYDISSALCR